jgi:hypothetical protein
LSRTTIRIHRNPNSNSDDFLEYECEEWQLSESHHWPRPKKGEKREPHPPMSHATITLKLKGKVVRKP